MSVIIDATCDGETFEVEVFRDRSIEFPGRDFQRDQAVGEFSPPGPVTIKFYELWKEAPIKAISNNFELPKGSEIRLAADYAEHVLHFYEDKCQGDIRIRNAIETVKKFVIGEVDLKTIEQVEAKTWAVADDPKLYEAKGLMSAARAAGSAARALSMSASGSADSAAEATAYSVSFDSESIGWQRGYDTEIAWQVRRFVDVMEAIGQGFDWPDLKATP